MAQSNALIDDLTDPGVWTGFLTNISSWLENNIFSQETVLGLAIILLAGAAAWPLSKRLCKYLVVVQARYSKNIILSRIWQSAIDLSFIAVWLFITWFAVAITDQFNIPNALIVITTSLLTAWIIIKFASIFVSSHFWSRTIAATAWLIAALNILGILDQTMLVLDEISFTIGQVNISLLTIIQAVITLGILLWITAFAGQITESRLKASQNLTPSMQVLSIKFIRIALGTAAFLTALVVVGVDLTAFAVVGGAVGVGLGFGLQKIFANLISGFILLLDKSIKPGDVIAIADYYGRVDELTARYVSVTTRDGIEHLIPNEELIINRVENWSHSHNLLRLRRVVGVHYKSDVHKAIALCLEAASEVPRILSDPAPNCLLREFGDSSVNLELRFWINDPMNGRANVTSELLLIIWDKFHANNIEIPYPQRDLHLRSSDIGDLAVDSSAVIGSE